MYCTRNVTADLVWVGADDRRLACFEGVYGVPDGVSYNSYLLRDEKTVLFDTVDKAVGRTFLKMSPMSCRAESSTTWSYPIWSPTTPRR